MTANTKWEEIQRALKDGESATNRPMLIARVFKQKLKALVKRVMKGDLFGKVLAHVGTVEFQKRGIPHAHLLFILDKKDKMSLKSPEEYDRFVFAEIPDREKNPLLFERVTSHMVHRPCHKMDSSCTKSDGYCKANFPKPFNESTTVDELGFPKYRRRCNGFTVKKYFKGKCFIVDNRNIVPYNPTLLLEFNCHINVEVVSSLQSVKYLFKYLHKGVPRSSVSIKRDNEHNEIQQYVSNQMVKYAKPKNSRTPPKVPMTRAVSKRAIGVSATNERI